MLQILTRFNEKVLSRTHREEGFLHNIFGHDIVMRSNAYWKRQSTPGAPQVNEKRASNVGDSPGNTRVRYQESESEFPQ